MAKVTLTQSVRVSATGEITTLKALLDAGRAHVVKVENFGTAGRTAYFADMEDGSGWEIGKTAYESRMGIKPDFSRKPLAKEVNDYKGWRVTIRQQDAMWYLSASKKYGWGGYHRSHEDRDHLVRDFIEFCKSPLS